MAKRSSATEADAKRSPATEADGIAVTAKERDQFGDRGPLYHFRIVESGTIRTEREYRKFLSDPQMMRAVDSYEIAIKNQEQAAASNPPADQTEGGAGEAAGQEAAG